MWLVHMCLEVLGGFSALYGLLAVAESVDSVRKLAAKTAAIEAELAEVRKGKLECSKN